MNEIDSPRVLLLAGPSETTNILFNSLQKSADLVGVILEERESLRRFLRRRRRRLGLPKVLGQVLFAGLIVPSVRRRSRNRVEEIMRSLHLDDSPIPEGSIQRVRSANGKTAKMLLRSHAPDVVVVKGTRILSARLLATLEASFINMHSGITPQYRGVYGAYWALAERRPELCGVTVHRVDTGIDTGEVLAQETIVPQEEDNIVTYPYLQLGVGIRLLESLLRNGLSNGPGPLSPADSESRLRYHPTLLEYASNRWRNGVR